MSDTNDFCTCSSCGADLHDGEIHQDLRDLYGAEDSCFYGCGRPPHGSRIISIYDRGLDCTVAWRCPDCGFEKPHIRKVIRSY